MNDPTIPLLTEFLRESCGVIITWLKYETVLMNITMNQFELNVYEYITNIPNDPNYEFISELLEIQQMEL